MWFEENNHEEADTLMICLAAAAVQRCPKAQMVIFSPDTDVLVLAVAHYEKLCTNRAVCMASGRLEIEPIWNALGREKATALMAFHAFTGADNVGKLSGIGKTKWVQQFMKADRDIISALIKLSEEGDLPQEARNALENLCAWYTARKVSI